MSQEQNLFASDKAIVQNTQRHLNEDVTSYYQICIYCQLVNRSIVSKMRAHTHKNIFKLEDKICIIETQAKISERRKPYRQITTNYKAKKNVSSKAICQIGPLKQSQQKPINNLIKVSQVRYQIQQNQQSEDEDEDDEFQQQYQMWLEIAEQQYEYFGRNGFPDQSYYSNNQQQRQNINNSSQQEHIIYTNFQKIYDITDFKQVKDANPQNISGDVQQNCEFDNNSRKQESLQKIRQSQQRIYDLKQPQKSQFKQQSSNQISKINHQQDSFCCQNSSFHLNSEEEDNFIGSQQSDQWENSSKDQSFFQLKQGSLSQQQIDSEQTL